MTKVVEQLTGQEKIKQLAESLNESSSSSTSTLSNSPLSSPIMVNDLETKLISEEQNKTDVVISNENQTEESNGEAKPDDNELILIQDSAFTIKIQVPGLDAFDLQVTSMELVQEIHQMLMDKEETCHRTCFSLQLDGIPLDNFSELKTFENLKEGSVIKLIEEPYTVREVRLHVRHVNELIHSIDPIDNFMGTNCNSLSYVNEVTNGEISDKAKVEQAQEKSFLPPDYILPNGKDVPVSQLHVNAINKDVSFGFIISVGYLFYQKIKFCQENKILIRKYE